MRAQHGFTLVEVLIVIAIVGVLAAVMIPTLMSARTAASNRAAQVYAHNVYVAGAAYVAEDRSHSFPTGDCTSGYVAGSFNAVPPPSDVVVSCLVKDTNGNGKVDVIVTARSGTSYVFP